ncbi:hypothetical protein RB619_02640 [Flavobacterium sp. LHD-80]|uniref:hypothetical protein n=1 Tax=Flavobacterium sp. LHD-80 TaxID=3071411 RepID=UPI0027DEE6AD|nr:hypothetical protein [Flavobacterium sp. LHD-80]MDQ6469526.1 hypothetical protein [Flavobacterium sp. LHD-80]
MKPSALALMEAASFCAGVRRKRYSGQQETAPENYPSPDTSGRSGWQSGEFLVLNKIIIFFEMKYFIFASTKN